MENPRLSKSVRRITMLRKDASGSVAAVVVYKKARKRKKGTKAFKFAERATRRMMEAQQKAAERYLEKHNKSNNKKKDGWLRDYGVNSARAANKGVKALKLRRAFSV
jgi:uncharacterized protein DUF6312/UvrC-like protein